jgi:hypothetical protein
MSKQWAHSETDATQRRRSFQGCEGTALLVSETCRGPGYFIEQLLFPFYKYVVFVSSFFVYNGRNYIPVATSQAHAKKWGVPFDCWDTLALHAELLAG